VIRISVVVPFYNGEATLGACLDALTSQNIPRDNYEIIAVDDGSTDRSPGLAMRDGVRLLRQKNRGAPAARNAGIAAATGEWVAFTDSDCIPSRGWLRALLAAAASAQKSVVVLAAAGPVVGQLSNAPAARFVDISGGLDAERHLSHPRFPFAPSGNVMYRRDALEEVGGFDERYTAYDACDLHARLRVAVGGETVFSKAAVVMHRHRDTWAEYWRQQVNYGRGLAQFYVRWADEIRWSPLREMGEWVSLAPAAAVACLPGSADIVLARRGRFVKRLAQRVGFARTYFKSEERARWRDERSQAR
jgi:O-antigen biosynthesis protein